MKLSSENEWIQLVRNEKTEEKKPNYDMSNIDPVLEELTGNQLELLGPLNDSYLREIAKDMSTLT